VRDDEKHGRARDVVNETARGEEGELIYCSLAHHAVAIENVEFTHQLR
jgi:hypothetical protein